MSISFIDGIIRSKRADLDELERFSRTPAYEQLLQLALKRQISDQERWLADWLIQPHFGLGCRAIDLVSRPDGLSRLADQILQLEAKMLAPAPILSMLANGSTSCSWASSASSSSLTGLGCVNGL